MTKLFFIAGFMSFLATASVPAVVSQAKNPKVQQELAQSSPELYIYSGSTAGIVFMFLGALRYVVSSQDKANSKKDEHHANTIAGIVKSHDKREESDVKVIEALNTLSTTIATNSERMHSICRAENR
tara:strand:+ start:8068 stop:8448 length:381 start_codon:yes stop_codon:yes gene_type:complete